MHLIFLDFHIALATYTSIVCANLQDYSHSAYKPPTWYAALGAFRMRAANSNKYNQPP